MDIGEMKEKLKSSEYSFLRRDEHLGKKTILLSVGGSHAYGTENQNSDLDIRGCTLNTKEELLGAQLFNSDNIFEQFKDEDTDTVIYSFNKLIRLLCDCNPNVIEMLGCKPEHYLYVSPIGQELLDNSHLFLSQKAIHSFGGYANAQLHRLSNKSNRLVGQAEQEIHILNTIIHVATTFKEKYFDFPNDSIRLYIDKSFQEDYDTEIYMDIVLKHYPLRDWKGMWSEMASIVKSYSKIGKRNKNAILHDKLGKHMMHLVRLYYMCLDILEKEKIVTYRSEEHDLLMDIRNGKYLDKKDQPTKEFYELIHDLETKFDYAIKNTSLPELPDYKKIKEFVIGVNERVVSNEEIEC